MYIFKGQSETNFFIICSNMDITQKYIYLWKMFFINHFNKEFHLCSTHIFHIFWFLVPKANICIQSDNTSWRHSIKMFNDHSRHFLISAKDFLTLSSVDTRHKSIFMLIKHRKVAIYSVDTYNQCSLFLVVMHNLDNELCLLLIVHDFMCHDWL